MKTISLAILFSLHGFPFPPGFAADAFTPLRAVPFTQVKLEAAESWTESGRIPEILEEELKNSSNT